MRRRSRNRLSHSVSLGLLVSLSLLCPACLSLSLIVGLPLSSLAPEPVGLYQCNTTSVLSPPSLSLNAGYRGLPHQLQLYIASKTPPDPSGRLSDLTSKPKTLYLKPWTGLGSCHVFRERALRSRIYPAFHSLCLIADGLSVPVRAISFCRRESQLARPPQMGT